MKMMDIHMYIVMICVTYKYISVVYCCYSDNNLWWFPQVMGDMIDGEDHYGNSRVRCCHLGLLHMV